ncbi:Disease resistance-like protein DSC1 [Citrus sinensis]|uniref:Disease resistance-like protein DSC1 n=1 Tax=Citrus sinensis TaxID=2711 RepID=A0ACB8MBS7_CITSI|nr:TMV resistance protein N [Citrus x clementina]KAH9783333.1 Disease resistance-like protein DSC1 [Citrus sinensis]
MSNCELKLRQDNTILNKVRNQLWDLPNMQPGFIFQLRAHHVINQRATSAKPDTFLYLQSDHTLFVTYNNMFHFLSNILADEGVTVDANGCFLSDKGLHLLRLDASGGMPIMFPQSVRIYTLTKLVVCVLDYFKRLRTNPSNRFRKFVPIAMDLRMAINNKSNVTRLPEKRIESEKDCAICLDGIVVGQLASCTPCDHVFHKRGEDTRVIFISHLYAALCRKKIKTFTDNEDLNRGDEISPALLNAIEGSKISVIIFSKGYASSKWCLNELVKILDCKKANDQIVIPVFYNVSPFSVRHQTGIFGDAFVKFGQQFREKPEMVQKWRDELTETSHLAGHESTKFRNDALLIDKIVEDVLKNLEKITISTDSYNGLVGLNSRIEQIKPLLCMELSDTVQIVGIWGMGGIGKITLATAIFNQFSGGFEGTCFVADVRRNSGTGGGLEHLQKQILSTILSEKLEVAGPNIPQFTKGRFRCMKVLIVLDNVSKVGQLEGLIGGLDQFGLGSRIIITTRDKRVLEKFGVKKIYRVNGLQFDVALEQFCNYAFKENRCPKDLIGHSWRVVRYAKGNPLALKISFNDLTFEAKNIFLDIACFFEGEDKDFVMRVLDDFVSPELDVLIDKSLVTILDNRLQMHDLLQEMGREIVHKESNEEPGKRSRLWDHRDVSRVLKYNKKAPKLKYIDLNDSTNLTRIPEPSETPNLERMNLRNCTRLALIPSYIQNFNNLANLSLEGCESLRCFPQNIHFVSSIKINCSECVNLREFPRISGNGVELKLRHTPIEEVPSSIDCLPDLETLEMSNCYSLKSLSTSICKLKSLRSLHLAFCEQLGSFPEILEKMQLLEIINLEEASNIKELPSSIENLEGLRELQLMGCTKLGSLPESLGNLKALEFLSAAGVSTTTPQAPLSYREIIKIPRDIGCLSSLVELDLSRNNFESLPSGISHLSRLKWLHLFDCIMLQSSLPELPPHLVMLDARNCKRLQSLPELPSCLEALDASVVETLSNHTSESNMFLSPFIFVNCLKLNQNQSIWAYMQQRIQQVTIASLRLFCEKEFDKPRGISFCLPGSEIPELFSNRSLGSSITIQLPHRCGNKFFIGFAINVVIEIDSDHDNTSCVFRVGCKFGSNHQYFFELFDNAGFNSNHVMLGLYPCWNIGIGLPDGDNGGHQAAAALSFDFLIQYWSDFGKGHHKVKCCGVSPVYANPNQAKPNAFTFQFGASCEDVLDNAEIVGGSDHEDEEESICREQQFNGPRWQTSKFSQILNNVCCFDNDP